MTSGNKAAAVHEIVYVETAGLRLYAEVIQVIDARPGQRLVSEGYGPTNGPRLWVRPLCICESNGTERSFHEVQAPQVYDLRGGSDLVWPADVFENALDTDWMNIILHLQPNAPALGMRSLQDPTQAKLAHHKLRQFLAAVQAA